MPTHRGRQLVGRNGWLGLEPSPDLVDWSLLWLAEKHPRVVRAAVGDSNSTSASGWLSLLNPCSSSSNPACAANRTSHLVLSPFGRLVPTPNTAYSAMDAGAYEPWIPDFDGNSRWRWEWWKVGLQPEALFTTLEAQYNTVPYRIQDDEAFHHDVSDAAHEAKNVDDFHARLARRRDERLQELRKAWTASLSACSTRRPCWMIPRPGGAPSNTPPRTALWTRL